MNDFIIKKLTELLIKQSFEDKSKGKESYVKKTTIYKDLIKFFKNEMDFIDNKSLK